MTALLLFCFLSFCYSVFFTCNLFLCPSVTLSSLRATCFFVFLLLCLFYVQLVSLSFCYSVFFTCNLFLCPSVTLSFYVQFVSLSFCYSVFFTSNLFLCPSVTLSFLRAICFFVFLLLCLLYKQLVNSFTRQLVNLLPNC